MNKKIFSVAVLGLSLAALPSSATETGFHIFSSTKLQPQFKIPTDELSRVMTTTGGSQHNSTPKDGYGANQIRTAYGINSFPGDGAGQTIALVDAYGNPTMENDLNTFSKQYNLPQTGEFNFQVVYAGGKPSTSSAEANGWMVETSLDVEWAHAVAPKANIILVVAKSPSNSSLMLAVDAAVKAGANVVSMSFGGPESKTGKTESQGDKHFEASGVTFVASSGDDGAGVSYPASSPYVLAVGGTTLPLDSSGNLTGEETAWSGSGGGVSAVESAPSFQSQLVQARMRAMPDVSYNADPKTGYAIYFSNPYKITQGKKTATVSGWFEVGGTSAGSPQWAALIAVANSQRNSPLSTLDALYALAGQNESGYFREITSGCDGKAATDCAGPGYNLVTGLGSPLANQLLPALASY